MAFLSCTILFAAVIVLILANAARNMYMLLHPLDGVEISGLTVDPLWPEQQPFDMLCYFSTSARFKAAINVTELRAQGRIVFERSNLRHQHSQEEMRINLMINQQAAIGNDPGGEEVVFTAPAAFWQRIHRNDSSLYLHVVLTRHEGDNVAGEEILIDKKAMKAGRALHGAVQLVKYDVIPKHFQHRYLLSDFGLVEHSTEDMKRLAMPSNTVISYWKPEVAVRLVNDFTRYPYDYVPRAMHEDLIYLNGRQPPARYRLVAEEPTEAVTWAHYKPSIHVDEIGLTSDKYIPLNETAGQLPLTISFGPLSLQRWLLMSHLAESIEAQAELGFTDKDIDDVRRLITDTSMALLGLTILASVLHLMFELLAIKSDIQFWQENKSLAGLSTRSVIIELFSQIVVLLFLLDSDTSMLVIIPAGAGIIVQAWKVRKATGLQIRFSESGLPIGLTFSRWHRQEQLLQQPETAAKQEIDSTRPKDDMKLSLPAKEKTAVVASEDDELTLVTLEADQFATVYLTTALLPLVLLFITHSLIYEKHYSWYSWAIGALTGCVYTFGFILMVPQLYINHRLKSVSFLPWNYLAYKFINTFIDDLFAFIIKMPTMHRLSVFRDDLIFIIYLYQRWSYRIDSSRPAEK